MNPYPHWTTCKSVGDVDAFQTWTASTIVALVGGIVLLISGIIASIGGFANPVTLAVGAAGLAVAASAAAEKVRSVKEYFLNGRLVCIADDVCAIGRVFSLEDDADGDRSINLVLAPASEDHTEDEYRQMFQAANLVYPDPGVNAAHGWTFDPHSNTQWLRDAGDLQHADFGENRLPLFHTEIEGTALVDYLDSVYAWLVAVAVMSSVIAAVAGALTAAGPIGWIILGILIVVTIIFATLLDTDDELTDPIVAEAPEIDGALPTEDGPVLIVNDDNTTIRAGDILILFGRHVCDTAHHEDWGCWNEIHPIKGILKVNRPRPADPGDAEGLPNPAEELYAAVAWDESEDAVVVKYCAAVRAAFDPTLRVTEPFLMHQAVG